MGILDNIPHKRLCKLLELHGWYFDRQTGSHIIYKKDNFLGRIVIPKHKKEVKAYVVRQIIKLYLNITEEEFIRQIKKI